MKTTVITTIISLVLFLSSSPQWAMAQEHHHGGHGTNNGHQMDDHLSTPQPETQSNQVGIFSTNGTVTAINTELGLITLDHEQVQALNWGPMVMTFQVEDPSLLKDLKVGDKIRFDIRSDGSNFSISDLEKVS